MKKIISVLLVLCMAMACVLSFTPAVYAEGDFDIGFGNVEITGGIGDQFTLVLKATNNPGFAASQPQLTFDTSCLRLVSMPTKIADIKYFTPTGKLDINPYQLGIADTDNLLDEDLIACTFEILDGGKSTATVTVSAGGTTKTWKGVELFPTFSGATIHIDGSEPTSDLTTADYSYTSGKNGDEFEFNGDSAEEIIIPADVTNIDVAYIPDDTAVVIFPATVETVAECAFEDCGIGDGAEFYFFNGTTEIGEYAVGSFFTKKGGDQYCEDVIIHGWTGSTAEDYAEASGFDFVPLEEFTPIGAQNGKDGGALRVIARMRYAEHYEAASLAFSAEGEDDAGAAISKTFTYEVKTVYKGIKGTNNGTTFEAKSATDGYYLSAVAVKNLPVFTGSGYITFTVTPTVVNDLGETVELEAVEFTYDKDGYHA